MGQLGGKTMLKNGDLRFYEDKVFFADSNLFRVFTHKFIEGDARTALMAPKSIGAYTISCRKIFWEKYKLCWQNTRECKWRCI